MTTQEIKNKLETIAQQTEQTIERFIAYDSLNYDEDDCTTYIKNILNPKTSMSMTFQFIQYSDVDTFYSTYKTDVLKKQKEYGITAKDLSEFRGDSIYNLCWIVIEETATKMAKEFGIEI